jgi:hypothetical protein
VNSSQHHQGLNSHRSQSVHNSYSGSSPTVPRVREDSPSAIFRPIPSSSIPNLEILREEEEEDNIPSNEQSSLTSLIFPKPNSYQSLPKYHFVLPTIDESHDHESSDDKAKQENSLVATNTNYNQNLDKERTDMNNPMMEFTLNKRINELLKQRKSQRQNKVREIMLLFATSTYQ